MVFLAVHQTRLPQVPLPERPSMNFIPPLFLLINILITSLQSSIVATFSLILVILVVNFGWRCGSIIILVYCDGGIHIIIVPMHGANVITACMHCA